MVTLGNAYIALNSYKYVIHSGYIRWAVHSVFSSVHVNTFKTLTMNLTIKLYYFFQTSSLLKMFLYENEKRFGSKIIS